MWDLLVILSLFVINTRSCDATPTSPPHFLATNSDEAPEEEDDEGIGMLASDDDDEDERYSGLVGNEDSIIPWNEVYYNLGLRGKRNPWEAAYSIRGKKVRVRMKREPDSLYPWEAVYSLRGKKTVANLPWQMSLQSPMLRGKKSAAQMPWTMNLQSPMLRGKKTKTLVNLPWQMDLKSPMLRGKKSSSALTPVEMTIENPIFGAENTSDFADEMLKAKRDNIKTQANLPWTFDYLSPMMRG